jgi:hypothetical protein
MAFFVCTSWSLMFKAVVNYFMARLVIPKFFIHVKH